LDRVARRETVVARFVQARPGDRQRRRDEHAVLVLLQQVLRLLVGVRRVVDHVDAVPNAHLDRLGASRMRGDAAVLLSRDLAYGGGLVVCNWRAGATTSPDISGRAEVIAGADASPDGTIFSTSTPSRQASRAARRNSAGP